MFGLYALGESETQAAGHASQSDPKSSSKLNAPSAFASDSREGKKIIEKNVCTLARRAPVTNSIRKGHLRLAQAVGGPSSNAS